MSQTHCRSTPRYGTINLFSFQPFAFFAACLAPCHCTSSSHPLPPPFSFSSLHRLCEQGAWWASVLDTLQKAKQSRQQHQRTVINTAALTCVAALRAAAWPSKMPIATLLQTARAALEGLIKSDFDQDVCSALARSLLYAVAMAVTRQQAGVSLASSAALVQCLLAAAAAVHIDDAPLGQLYPEVQHLLSNMQQQRVLTARAILAATPLRSLAHGPDAAVELGPVQAILSSALGVEWPSLEEVLHPLLGPAHSTGVLHTHGPDMDRQLLLLLAQDPRTLAFLSLRFARSHAFWVFACPSAPFLLFFAILACLCQPPSPVPFFFFFFFFFFCPTGIQTTSCSGQPSS